MRKLCLFVCGWTAATALAVYLLGEYKWLAAALALAALVCWAGLLALRRRRGPGKGRGRAACLLLGAALALGWYLTYSQLWYASAADAAIGVRRCTFQVTDYCRETQYGGWVYARILDARAPVKTLVYLDEYDPALSPGDTLTGVFDVCLSSADSGSDYYDSAGIFLTAAQAGDCATQPGPALLRAVFFPKKLAKALGGVLDASFQPRQAAFLKALLIGDRSGLSYSLTNHMKLAGIYHAIAISGLHVNILVTFLGLLLPKHKKLRALVCIPVIAVFVVMTGASPSICRAGLMQSLLLLAPLLRREQDGLTTLALALLVLLTPNPMAVRHMGLQLSFASVLGLLLFSDRLEAWFRGCQPKRLAQRPVSAALWKTAASMASATFAALVFTTPLCALYFGTVSLVAPVTNLLGLWAVTFCFVGAMALCLLGLVWLPLAQGLAWLVGLGVDYITGLCATLAGLPLSCLYTLNPGVWVWLAFVYLAAVVYLTGRGKHLRRLLCCGTIVLCVVVAVPVLSARGAEYLLRALDVGQGQCLLLSSGSTSAVIDCGGSRGEEAGEKAARYLLTQGEFAPELLLLTHYDTDHTGGVEQLLSRVQVKTLCLPTTGDAAQREQLEALAREANTQVLYITQDVALAFGTGRLRLFAPEDTGDANDCMAVLASFAETDIVVTGDMDTEAEARLLCRYPFPDTEVLLAGHHGSKTSTGAPLLDTLTPETVLISVGQNRYGHPAQAVLDRCAAAGAAIYRTDECGTITLRR